MEALQENPLLKTILLSCRSLKALDAEILATPSFARAVDGPSDDYLRGRMDAYLAVEKILAHLYEQTAEDEINLEETLNIQTNA